MRHRGTGSIYKQPGCSTYTIKYYRSGKAIREATGLTDYQAARQKLNQRLSQISEGTFAGLNVERIRVEELIPAFFRHQTVKGGKDVARGEKRWTKHLESFFAGRRVLDVTTDVLNQYVDRRLAERARPATINREIAILRGVFRLGAKATPPKVQRLPAFPHLKENNVRVGFVEDHQRDRLQAAAASELWLRAMIEMGSEYGWRVGELKRLRVEQADFVAGRIRLDVGTTKNGRGRIVAMTTNVRALLAACVEGKNRKDFMFTRNGRPIGDFRKRWRKLCIAAGVGRVICRHCGEPVADDKCEHCDSDALKYAGLIFHDLRRSAVRNLVRSGVSERIAMEITGHKTRDVFDRYDIVSERDLEDAARKSEARRAKVAQSAEFGHENGHDSAGSEASVN